jgi:hypothetical protein
VQRRRWWVLQLKKERPTTESLGLAVPSQLPNDRREGRGEGRWTGGVFPTSEPGAGENPGEDLDGETDKFE